MAKFIIQEHSLNYGTSCSITLHPNSEILSVGFLRGTPTLWVKVSDETEHLVTRHFSVLSSYAEVPPNHVFVGTAFDKQLQSHEGMQTAFNASVATTDPFESVYHVFEYIPLLKPTG